MSVSTGLPREPTTENAEKAVRFVRDNPPELPNGLSDLSKFHEFNLYYTYVSQWVNKNPVSVSGQECWAGLKWATQSDEHEELFMKAWKQE